MKKTLFLAAFSLLMSNAVMAQDCCADGGKLKSYSFVEVQGGLEWTTTDAKIDKLLMPIGAVSVGHYFTPVVGARLHVSGIQAKGRFESMDKDYKWNFITTNADVLINLTNLFSKNYSHPLNLIFVWSVTKKMRQHRVHWYYNVWAALIVVALFLQIWQDYAEGMVILALSLLA